MPDQPAPSAPSPDTPMSPPTTKAVAIRDSGSLGPRDGSSSVDAQKAPRITAKGSGFRAEKILDVAFAEGVKVRQDPDLVELLDAFDVDSPIPLEALTAVGLILERVYQANQGSQQDTPLKGADIKGAGVPPLNPS